MAALAWALWALTLVALALVGWFDRLLTQAGRPDLALVTSDIPAYVLATLSATTVGALLASRRPRHPVGWLLLGLGLPVALSGVATGYANYGLMARPGSLPAADWAALYHGVSILGGPHLPAVRPAADPDRVAAVAAVALVGLVRGRRGGGGAGVGVAAAAGPALPGGSQPAGRARAGRPCCGPSAGWHGS